MKEYIDKAALIAEIESKKKRAQILGDNAINSSMQQFFDGMKQGCVDILSFLDTLEVGEIHEDIDMDLNPFFEELGVESDSRIASMFKESFYKGINRYLNKKEDKL